MKKNNILLISAIIGTIYLIYLIFNFKNGVLIVNNVLINMANGLLTTNNIFNNLISSLATIIVAPHMLFVGLSVIFNWIGWTMNLRWTALVSGILYAVSMLLMIIYAPFVLIQMVLSFVAFSKMKNINQQ